MIAIDALRAGEPRAMARAISTVERGDADTRALIGAIFRFTGNAHVIGITGSPGTGKSTLVNALAKYFRKLNSRVGILAVDPTSPFTGGALLGDRVRMLGAGQSEVDIVKHAHTTIVVQAPGMGDDIQANKAGILEIADVIVVNKADRDEANATMAVLEMNLNLKPRTENEWRAPVLKTIAIKADGIAQVVEAVNNHRAHLLAHQQWQARARARWRAELQAVLEREFLARMYSGMQAKKFDALVEKIAARELDVYAAAEQWTENQT
ncbi:MAG: methylmalonyl Co-A mutase-associated GTPase MeaB [Chloroflexi bacterium]|nr:methylmalonyl Co-A mutase-associated GTPase MeaB [Chloroflexota bacterium]